MRTVTACFLLALAIFTVFPQTAAAAEVSELTVDFPLADVLDMPPGASEGVSPGGPSGALPVGVRAPWEKDWFAYRQNAVRGDPGEAKKNLGRIVSYRVETGIPDLYLPAAALLLEASQAMEQSRYKSALELIDYAGKLAPDYPAPFFLKAQARWRQSRLRVLASLDTVLEGWGAFFKDFRSIFPWITGLMLWILSSVLVASIVTIFLLSIRVFPRAAHDLSHMIRVPQWVWYIIIPVFLGILLLTGMAFIMWVILAALLMVAHLHSGERVAVALAVLLLISLPLLVHVLALNNSFFGGGSGLTVYTAEMSGEGIRTIDELHKLRVQDPDNVQILSTLAVVLKRGGKVREAESLLRQALEKDPESPSILNNLANVLMGSGRFADSIDFYKRALRYSDDPRIHYNLSQALRENLQLEEGEKEFRQAQEMDPKLAGSLAADQPGGKRRITIDISGSLMGYLEGAAKLDPDGIRWREGLWSDIIPKVPFAFSWFVFPLAALLLFAGRPLESRLATANRCRQCGRLHCPTCSESSDESFCSQCRQIFRIRTGVDPASRVRKMMQIMRFKRKRALLARFLTILFPGMGHTLLGAGWQSVVMIIITTCFWMKWVLWYGLYRDTTNLVFQTGPESRILFITLFVLYYVAALYSVGRKLEKD
ncbi:MAG: tetratricopeptide repeat protein [Deltaproteobacteria bacterium]|nr:tetratricopeptide repeat protein [Deltaproteobacteria bacterium]